MMVDDEPLIRKAVSMEMNERGSNATIGSERTMNATIGTRTYHERDHRERTYLVR